MLPYPSTSWMWFVHALAAPCPYPALSQGKLCDAMMIVELDRRYGDAPRPQALARNARYAAENVRLVLRNRFRDGDGCRRDSCMRSGLPHPPSPPPPPHGIPPLPVKWVVVLFGVVAFLVWSCLASSPPPLWSGACGLFGWPRPACVFYRGMVWLLPLVSSNVIVMCLVPSPAVWGSVFYRDMVVSSNVIVMCLVPSLPVWGSVFYIQRYGMVAVAC